MILRVYDPAGNLVYDDYLDHAPEQISIVQELPVEEMVLHDHTNHLITPWKGSDGQSYSDPFNDNTIDQFMFERSMMARGIVLSWDVADHAFANLWWLWTEFGCTIYLYRGKRYDPTGSGEGIGILGVDGYNVWVDWPWIDPDESIRFWKNGVEVYNKLYPGNWTGESSGGRFAEEDAQSAVSAPIRTARRETLPNQ